DAVQLIRARAATRPQRHPPGRESGASTRQEEAGHERDHFRRALAHRRPAPAHGRHAPAHGERRPGAGVMNPAAARETLAGQSAVVTGGARGIGAAIAGALARAGAQIWLLDHDEDALRAAAAAIGARAIVADVRDHAAMIAAAERVAREDG